MARTITQRDGLREMGAGPGRVRNNGRIDVGVRHGHRRAVRAKTAVKGGSWHRITKPNNGRTNGVSAVAWLLVLGQRHGELESQKAPVQMQDETAKEDG